MPAACNCCEHWAATHSSAATSQRSLVLFSRTASDATATAVHELCANTQHRLEKAKKHSLFCTGNLGSANQHLQHERSKAQEKQAQLERR
jgi:hypothetical protein